MNWREFNSTHDIQPWGSGNTIQKGGTMATKKAAVKKSKKTVNTAKKAKKAK